MAVESYIVVIAERNGKKVGDRHKLNIPVAAARGHYEDLSDRALDDLVKDLWHEQRRREGDTLEQPSSTKKFNPYNSQFTG